MEPIQLTIPTPCQQSWDKMTPNQQGRFCASCAKTVVDFSAMSDAELIQYFENLKNEDVCGRVRPQQLNRELAAEVSTIVKVIEPAKKRAWYWQYAAAFLLFFVKGQSVKAQGEIKAQNVKDTSVKPVPIDVQPIRLGGIRRIQPENVCVLPAQITQLFVTDEKKRAIAGASVQLLPEGKWMVTNNEGKINLGLNHKVESVKISAIGYAEKLVALKNIQGNSVALALNPTLMGDVEVMALNNSITDKMVAGGISVKRTEALDKKPEKVTSEKNNTNAVSIFPNPVKSGEQLKFNNTDNAIKTFAISDINGSVLIKQAIGSKVNNTITIPATWSSGTYILSLYNTKGEIIQSEKFMVL